MGAQKVSVTLADLWAELERGNIVEASIQEAGGAHMHGLCDYETGRLVLDPRTETVDTLLHELMHRRHARWGEARVRRETARLMRQMDDAEKTKWWRKYQRVKRKARPVKVEL